MSILAGHIVQERLSSLYEEFVQLLAPQILISADGYKDYFNTNKHFNHINYMHRFKSSDWEKVYWTIQVEF